MNMIGRESDPAWKLVFQDQVLLYRAHLFRTTSVYRLITKVLSINLLETSLLTVG